MQMQLVKNILIKFYQIAQTKGRTAMSKCAWHENMDTPFTLTTVTDGEGISRLTFFPNS
jgi:hypothetical protein